MQIVDAQVHIWAGGKPSNPNHRQVPAFTKDELLKEMDAAGGDAGGLPPPPPRGPHAHEEAPEAAPQQPGRPPNPRKFPPDPPQGPRGTPTPGGGRGPTGRRG